MSVDNLPLLVEEQAQSGRFSTLDFSAAVVGGSTTRRVFTDSIANQVVSSHSIFSFKEIDGF